jgi:hypothetical protein
MDRLTFSALGIPLGSYLVHRRTGEVCQVESGNDFVRDFRKGQNRTIGSVTRRVDPRKNLDLLREWEFGGQSLYDRLVARTLGTPSRRTSAQDFYWALQSFETEHASIGATGKAVIASAKICGWAEQISENVEIMSFGDGMRVPDFPIVHEILVIHCLETADWTEKALRLAETQAGLKVVLTESSANASSLARAQESFRLRYLKRKYHQFEDRWLFVDRRSHERGGWHGSDFDGYFFRDI